ncbi:MAG: hypothetical protein AAF066_11215 [Pseudomonadota bacterium]
MIIGFGTRGQEGQLREAGAQRVFFHPDQLSDFIREAGMYLRPGDILLMVQPGILKAREFETLYKACDKDLLFQVVGRDPLPLKTLKHFSEFRKVKPVGVATEMVQLTGRPRTIDYTVEQANAIIRLWHEKPKRKPAEVTDLAKTILGLGEEVELKTTWVRDLVIKFVGSARRDKPDHWNGIEND